MGIKLSKRLQTIVDLIQPGVVADIGTDHGYVPIACVLSGKSKKAYALDVNEGPLLRAKEHIAQYGLEHQIETRLSDGLSGLKAEEADCVVLAGMGGLLMLRILSEGLSVLRSCKEMIFSPQSDLPAFRSFLMEHQIYIIEERMVYEDEKYYWILRCANAALQEASEDESKDIVSEAAILYFGRDLVMKCDATLYQYLQALQKKDTEILHRMQESGVEESRQASLVKELSLVGECILYMTGREGPPPLNEA